MPGLEKIVTKHNLNSAGRQAAIALGLGGLRDGTELAADGPPQFG